MKYLTLTDVSRKLGGRSRSSIYRDVDAGRLPEPIRIGRRLYWAEDAIERAIALLASVVSQ